MAKKLVVAPDKRTCQAHEGGKHVFLHFTDDEDSDVYMCECDAQIAYPNRTGEIMNLTMDMMKRALQPVLSSSNTWITEFGTCPRSLNPKAKEMGIETHNAHIERHWNGVEYDDTHMLCQVCALEYNLKGWNVKLCEQLKRPCAFKSWPRDQVMDKMIAKINPKSNKTI